MSLLQRVTSLDGNDLRPPEVDLKQLGYGTARSLRRVISYDVIPKPQDDSYATAPIGGVTQWKVSVTKRLAQVAISTVSCWLASGIVFGFAALKPVLVDQGVYRELCTKEEIGAGLEIRYEQDLRLNLFFAVASTAANFSALPAGTILDRYGPRFATIVGCAFLAMGSILMATSLQIEEFDGFTFGNIFLAIGGCFVFVPAFQVANSFPRYSGLIVAMITGAFDASAAIFLLFRQAYESSNGVLTPGKLFFGYLTVPVLIILAQLTVMNKDPYKTLPELEEKVEQAQEAARDVHDSDDDLSDREVRGRREERRNDRESQLAQLDQLLGDEEERKHRHEKQEEHQAVSGVWGALHGKSALEQVLSPWFILITLFTVLQMLRMNFFIATIRSQYEFILGSRSAARAINAFFDIALPVGGVAATPFIGMLLHRISTAMMLAILVILTTVVGVLGSLPFYWAAYTNVVLFTILRPLYYSTMSDYAAKVFGFATFGRVYGLIICFSGMVNLSQPLIDAANHQIFRENPIPINMIFVALGLAIGTALVAFVWAQDHKFHQQQVKVREVTERDRLIPEMEEARFY